MNRKQKKELRQRQPTRQLMRIDQLTEHGLKTARGELVFYLVSPDNLSVLSAEGVRGCVRALTELLRGTDTVELLALDSRESFQSNKLYYQERLEQETVPAAFRQRTRLSQHISFLKDFFRAYKDFRSMGPATTPRCPTSTTWSRTPTGTTTGRKTRCTPKNCYRRSCWASTPCAGARKAVLQRTHQHHVPPLSGVRREGAAPRQRRGE